MINLGKHSKLDPSMLIGKAVTFFGAGGLGLDIVNQSENSVQFEGGGGSVGVSANANGSGSDVTVLSQEWDYQAKQFVEQI